MKKLLPIIIIIIAGGLIFFTIKLKIFTPSSNTQVMNITSPAFKNNENLPPLYTCDSKNINPPLQIWNVPEKTKSLALIVDDPDAVMAGSAWVHWIVWDIPADTKSIAENSVPGVQGKTDFGKAGYGGPCPPTGTHRYSFRVYALDIMPGLSEGSTVTDLIPAMQGHILDQSELVGLYQHL
jgi:Raf kinase inhibitor-like YbhB/YbcL family protein